MTSQLDKVDRRQIFDHVGEAYTLIRQPIDATPEGTPRVSAQLVITLPVHNEASRLERNVVELERFLARERLASRIILAEDGSTDNSAHICSELARKYDNIMLSRRWARLGRGKAMREAWGEGGLTGFDFKYAMFMDADLATDLSAINSMLRELEAGNDLVLGSRYIAGSIVLRPRLRLVVSLAYNKIVRILFRNNIRDNQCGFKGFGPRALKELLPITIEHSCFWDTEVCVIGPKIGLKVVEIPVVWTEKRSRRTPIRRLFGDILDHGMGLIRLFPRYGRLRVRESTPAQSSP